jgi:hypothetical protein
VLGEAESPAAAAAAAASAAAAATNVDGVDGTATYRKRERERVLVSFRGFLHACEGDFLVSSVQYAIGTKSGSLPPRNATCSPRGQVEVSRCSTRFRFD